MTEDHAQWQRLIFKLHVRQLVDEHQVRMRMPLGNITFGSVSTSMARATGLPAGPLRPEPSRKKG
eukprot:39342-Eustigmatos_ZCMA.PRE.1